MITRAVILAGGEGSRLRPVTLEVPKPLIPVQGLPILTWQARWFARHGVEHITVVAPKKWQKAFEAWAVGANLVFAPSECDPHGSEFVPSGPTTSGPTTSGPTTSGPTTSGPTTSEPTTSGPTTSGPTTSGPEFAPREGRSQGSPLRIDIWIESEAMGTLGALVHHLGSDLGSEPVFVTNGDELKGLDLAALSSFHDEYKPAVTVALVRVPNPSDYGVAEMEEHLIRRFHEKPAIPPSTLVSSGLYVLEPSVLSEMDKTKTVLMFEKDLFPRLAEEGRLGGCALEGPWYDCGTMERWEKAIKEWREPGV